jgi:hypothetical protein
LECLIDTTFALHRAGEPFRRLKKALRVYAPFEARHLDWYDDTGTGDAVYAATSSSGISHWNNNDEVAQFRDEPLKFSSFQAVRPRPDGSPEVYVENLAPVVELKGRDRDENLMAPRFASES